MLQTALMVKEKAIRDQIAEKFTLEMKTVEMNCARKIKEIENEHFETITQIKEILERKAKEVDALKDFILDERSKVTQILDGKENEISELIKEHNVLREECQLATEKYKSLVDQSKTILEWKQKAEKYKEKAIRLESLEDVLKSERENFKLRINSTTKECMVMRAKVGELQAKLNEVEEKYDKLEADHTIIQDKYRNAKKTILTYKVHYFLLFIFVFFFYYY